MKYYLTTEELHNLESLAGKAMSANNKKEM